MKNNFITKIIGATLAFAMMIGGAVGINAAKEAKEVNAASTKVASFSRSGTTNSTTGGTFSFQAEGKSGYYQDGSGTLRYIQVLNNTPYWTTTPTSVSITAKIGGGTGNTNLTDPVNVSLLDNSGNIIETTTKAITSHITSNDGDTYSDVAITPANNVYGVRISHIKQSGYNVRYYSFDLYYEAGSGSGPVALTNPNPQYDDSNKTVSWTSDANATKYQVKVDSSEYADINTETYDASGLTVGEEHTVFIKAVGDETNYTSTEGSVKFTPTAPFVGKEYALCKSTDDLEAGTNYIFTSATTGSVKTMSTEENANNRKVTSLTVNAQTKRITSTVDTLVLELGGSEDHWTFKTTNYEGTNGYFASNSTSNHLKVQKNAGEATISFTNSYAVINLGPSTTNDLVRYNSGSTLFSCYSSGQSPVYLWKEYKELTGLNITGSPTKLTGYYDSEKFDPTGITAYEATYSDSSTKALTANDIKWPDLTANMGTIKGSYTEFGTTVYTPTYNISVAADSLSTVTLEGTIEKDHFTNDSWKKDNLVVKANYASGKHNTVTDDATIAFYRDSAMTEEVATPADLGVGDNQTIYVKATYQGLSNATAYAQTVSVTVEHGSVIDDPLTVDEAINKVVALAKGSETAKQYYIQGVVETVTENDLGGTHNNATFTLQESNQTFAFKAYRISPDVNLSGYDNLTPGAEVLIKCQIKKYDDSTIENGTEGSLLSISKAVIALESIAFNKANLYLGINDEETLNIIASPVGAELGDVSWESSNDSVATVDQDGKVTAVSRGTATITATAGGFEATCTVYVSQKATMQYVSDKTTNMAANNNATTVGLDADLFAVDAEKGDISNNFPGLNKDDEIRLYNGNIVKVEINSSKTVEKIKINCLDNAGAVKVFVKGVMVDPTDNSQHVYEISNNKFTIQSIGATVKIASVEIFYRDAIASELASRLNTQTSLSYHYSKDANNVYTYSNIVMRFGGNISKDLWNELDTNEHNITGFGVILMDGEMVKAEKDVSDAMSDMVLSTVSTDLNEHLAIEYFVPVANMDETIGSDSNNYFWNLCVSINNTEMNKLYTAVAYIKVGNEYVLMNFATESVETLALDYLTNRNCDSTTAGGSLQAIVDNAQ